MNTFFVLVALLSAAAAEPSVPVKQEIMEWTCAPSREGANWSFDVTISLTDGSADFANMKGFGKTTQSRGSVRFDKLESPKMADGSYAPVIVYTVNSDPSTDKISNVKMLSTYAWKINNWQDQKFISDSSFGILIIDGKSHNFKCEVFNHREESKS